MSYPMARPRLFAFLRLSVRSLICAGLVFAATAPSFAGPLATDQLVMFEQAGCPYCAQWDREVGNVYGKTDEAKSLSLRRVDLHAVRPADLRAIGAVRFTPTFVVLHCGKEAARITGYLGDEQFWGLLDAAIRTIKETPKCA